METTSRKYYEYKFREFQQFHRGRTEGIDYKWMIRAKKEYAKKDNDNTQRSSEKRSPLTRLNYESDESGDEALAPDCCGTNMSRDWTVGNVILTDLDGNEITIYSGSAAALGGLLTKIAYCHD